MEDLVFPFSGLGFRVEVLLGVCAGNLKPDTRSYSFSQDLVGIEFIGLMFQGPGMKGLSWEPQKGNPKNIVGI